MDKPTKTITIKVNGKERPYIEEKTMERKEDLMVVEEREHNEMSSEQKARPRRWRAHSPRWRSAMVAIVLAVLLGTSFGFGVLTIIPKQEREVPASATLKEETIDEQNESRSLDPLSVFVVQGGAFTNEQTLKTYVNKLQAAHFPTLTVGKDPVYLLIGIGLRKEDLASFVEAYQQIGQETYVKPWNVSVKMNKDHRQFFEELITFSTSLFSVKTIDEEQWKTLKTMYDQLDETEKKGHLGKAYNALLAYKQTNEKAAIWQAQQHLLNVLKSS
ncbi:stage II sporulation protein B [Thermolongibacillus altinsuensis]|uniref:Stage II sporulation protein B n=1 Tax=Thermolongibacillus altinsuensis TaxID=575256 RepID=A0A4V2QAH1_9BACL|nr:SPOR domain-containing protein [Thermolongibacillus altinsuensis]TCL51935.1 stage II sporulation protein B [Thermolongibacillus altinsuensis]